MSIRASRFLLKEHAVISDPAPAVRYSAALAFALAATGVRLALNPVFGPNSPYLPFALAIVFAARFGGRGAGFLATAASAASALILFLEKYDDSGIANPAAFLGLALFCVVGFLISWFVGRLRESLLSASRTAELLGRQAQLVDLSHDAIITADANRAIIGWNTGAAEMYGWTEPEVTGKVSYELLQTRSDVSNIEIDGILRERGRWQGELIHAARGGREIVTESRQVLLRDGKGAPSGILEIDRDVTDRKRAEAALRESEASVRLRLDSVLSPEADIGNLELSDIIDAKPIQSLLDEFNKLARLPMAIVDVSGKVLVRVGWQHVCTDFHRICPETRAHCIESDTQLTADLAVGETRLYKCRNQMWDVVTPLMIGGRHVGNIFSGQFFFEDEQVERELFRAQAVKYGFEEGAYLAALDEVPRLSRATVDAAMRFLAQFGEMIARLSYSNIKLAKSLTELKRAEQALREVSEQRELALEAAGLGAWEYNFQTGDLFWDERCRKVFGAGSNGRIKYDEVIARIHPDDRAATDEAVTQAIAGTNGGAYHREFRVVWPDGTVHWVASHGRAFAEGSGETRRITRFAGVNMDITDRRRAEESLRQKQKLETIGVLAGGVAHDFNNLLTVIMGSAAMALEECHSCVHAQSITSAAERAAYLTRQLLAYAGKGHHVLRLVDLSDAVSRSKELLSASVPKRVNLRFDLEKDLPLLEADPSLLEQIVMNLVVNAGEAIPAKSDGWIRVATSSCEVTAETARLHSDGYEVAAGGYVCLEVLDNGSGMDQATVSRIFDPFFTTKFTGRGLGLAAVHGIVRSRGGFIEVHSTPGVGTSLKVCLPASPNKPAPQPAVSAPRPKRVPERAKVSTILVIDDEEMVRKLAAMTLARYGYEVLEAENGKDALDVLADSPSLPSLALLDLAMPVMGGDELMPILAARYPDLKVILSSGYPEEEARKVLPSAAVSGFLQKPYTGVILAEKIEQALK